MVTVQFKRLQNGEGLPVPTRMTSGAAGMDVSAAEDCSILPGQRKIVRTGFAVAIPEGYEIQGRSRSGHAAKAGVFVLNSPATIDADYRGELMVILYNTGSDLFTVKRGDRIAQWVLNEVPTADVVLVDELPPSVRGDGGLGSTGTS